MTTILNESIAEIDSIISGLTQGSDGERNNSADRLVSLLRKHFCDNSSDLFEEQRPVENRRFITATLIRAMSYYTAYFDERQLSRKVVRLAEVSLDPQLIRELRLETREQTFDKQRRLLDAFRAAIEDLAKVTQDLSGIDRFGSFRSSFMRSFNSARVQAFIVPFIPIQVRRLVQSKETYESIQDYIDAIPIEKIASKARVDSALGLLAESINASGSQYCEQFIAPVVSKLSHAINQDFLNDTAIKRGDIKLEAADRKYPLREPSNRFDLGIIVTNEGPGIVVNLLIEIEAEIPVTQPSIFIQRFGVTSELLSFPAKTAEAYSEVGVIARATWNNSDGSSGEFEFDFTLEAQSELIDWREIDSDELYSVDAVTDTAHLIGRAADLGYLISGLSRENIPSFVMHGQKRVGKTSIAKTVGNVLSESNSDTIVVYTEGGDFRKPSAEASVNALGITLVKGFSKDNQIQSQAFDGTLSPLYDAILAYRQFKPRARFIFIIDEFDELPIDVYKPGPIGDSLFLNLRSLSSKEGVGFVLVGSEKMALILNQQGVNLNKWRMRKVDYFNRDEDRADFIDLIRKPAIGILEFTDAAIDEIYAYSAGNPFFTKVICRRIVDRAKLRRDGFVDVYDVRSAVQMAAREESLSIFSHFWTDGILESGARLEEVSARRRRLFYVVGDVLRRSEPKPREAIIKHDLLKSLGVSAIESELRDLERRDILNLKNDSLEFRVKLFREWLVSSGSTQIVTDLDDEDELVAERRRLEELTVQSFEIDDLVRSWVYQGRRIEIEAVRRWLQQFGPELIDQRLMFKLLSAIKYYGQDLIRQKMQDAFNMLSRQYQSVENAYQVRRDEYIITYLDSPAKSSAYMARLFAEENRLHIGSVVPRENLRKALLDRTRVRAVIVIDDFLGTGETIRTMGRNLWTENVDVLASRKLDLHIIAVVGFDAAVKETKSFFEKHRIDANLRICDILPEAARAFMPDSNVFADHVELSRAERIAKNIGEKISSKAPLGFQDSRALVVFEHNCPNNTLPIFWREFRQQWRPLFPRD